jgi:RimJ/RimL family protein N-acetyltransferase
MPHPLQSGRLYYREFLPEDAALLYELDTDPEVHRYLYDPVSADIAYCQNVIAYISQQYIDNGVGRMATFEKATYTFIGWTGLKLERNVNGRITFYDIGYRLMQKHWGKSYATEATRFFLDYAFDVLKADTVNAFAFTTNGASRRVLQKCGLKHTDTFDYEGVESVWYEINRADYEKA